MMHIPVDDRDPREPMDPAQVVHKDHVVGKHAEPASSVSLRMVARRPDQRIGIAHLALEDGICRGKNSAG